jgi:hypothetical protein
MGAREVGESPDVKTKLAILVIALPFSFTTLTGCSMTDKGNGSDEIPSAGTSTSSDAADAVEAISSEIYDLIDIKGKTSNSRATVTECPGKDSKKYFRILHPWSLTPSSPSDLEAAMTRLKTSLPKHGWKVIGYGPDTSKNKNVSLTANNDAKKVSVRIVQMANDNPPMLSVDVVSGCYKVPDGQEVEYF